MTKGFYPRAIIKGITPGSNDPAIRPRIAVLHVAVTTADSLHDYFDGPSGGIESHFYVRLDGTVEQYRSIYFQADAQLDANDFAVSIETAGMASGEWTAAQLKAIKRLLLWLHREAGIPLKRCTAWDGEGVGYHTMWGAPSHWTPVSKSCPGPDRIKQFDGVLTRWMWWQRKVKATAKFKPRHRIVSVNLRQDNPDPIGAIHQIVAKVKARFRWVPDVIACQETRFMLGKLGNIEGYQCFVASNEGEAGRELAVLLSDKHKCLGAEYQSAASGIPGGDPVLDHPRGIFTVKYRKRRRKVAVVNTHMGVFAEQRVGTDGAGGPSAKQHAAHAQAVLAKVAEIEAEGFLVFVTADANSDGTWQDSLPAVLEAAGKRLSQNRVDLVASDPKRVREPGVLVIPKTVIASDHDVLAISCQEK